MRRAGRGGYGEVWEARDEVDQRPVAVKRHLALAPQDELRVQREVEALHLLRIPGVVEIRDHGRDGAGLYLVMAWVEGVPFPTGGWSSLGPTALALLRALVGVHDAGVVHRDIKPANVLVRPDGEPVLVDFGLATGTALEPGLTRLGVALGTPHYRAPEQMRGDPLDGRADVYALGIMLYEALSGQLPHAALSEAALTEARLLRPAPPLRGPGLDVPAVVADVIAAMLRHDPADRWTARQALLALSGTRGGPAARLPRLGPEAPLRAVTAALRAGRTVDVFGPPGSGRTRLLEDVEAALGGGIWLARGERPFSSIPILARDLDPNQDSDAARAQVAARLSAPGLPVLGDDWALVDPWTRALLETDPPAAGLVRVVDGPAEVTLAPLGWEDLMPLFEGPDRILHSREDPARLLALHSGGLPTRMDALVRIWTRRGHLEPTEEGRYRMDRQSLASLAAEAPLPDGRDAADLPVPLRDLLGWVRFCAPHSRPDVLHAVAGLAVWELDLLASALVARGAARWEGEVLVPLADAPLAFTEEGRALAHAALAAVLPPGAPGRLRHLVAAGRVDALCDEALATSAREEQAGRLGHALEAVETARRLAPDRARLEGLRIRLLLARGTLEAAQQASFAARSAEDPALVALAEGVALCRTGRGRAAMEVLDALAPFSGDDRLEMVRLAARQEASRYLTLELQESMMNALGQAPVILRDPAHYSQWAGWMGTVRFRQGRFAEAASLHEQAAAGRPYVGRLNSLINAARAWLEANALERAEEIAAEAQALAREVRSPLQEALAEWVMRSAANRRGAVIPDAALVRCAEALGDAAALGQIALTEGFIAWRGGAHDMAAAFASLAERSFQTMGNALAATYSAALRFASDGTGDPRALAAAVWEVPPMIALDVLALLAGAGADLGAPKDRLRALAASFPPSELRWRRGAYAQEDAFHLLGLTLP